MTTTTQDKLGAYTAHQRGQEDSRETDARALLSCASRLKAAIDAGPGDMASYAEAIRFNQRLWTIFQVALCDPDNQLPGTLKTTLLNLSRYVDRVSFRAITEFSPPLLTGLIDINRMIASGLNVKQRPAETALVQPAAEHLPHAPAAVMTSA
ncbi:MAG: flagellar biosynthesis regulator FlaF [Pseudomonadota bacterium]|nr:flagellar biosynthesis regulator FlaF [Pseudomonadota bacterium]